MDLLLFQRKEGVGPESLPFSLFCPPDLVFLSVTLVSSFQRLVQNSEKSN